MRKVPFLRVCVMLVLGILINGFWPGDLFLKSAGLLIAFSVYAICKTVLKGMLYAVSLCGYSILAFTLCLGVVTSEIHSLRYDAGHYGHFLLDEAMSFTGQVEELTESSRSIQLLVSVSEIQSDTKKVEAHGQLKVYTKDAVVEEGAIIHFKAKANPVVSVNNPYAFNYASFLERKGIYFQAYVKNIDVLEVKQSRIEKFRKLAFDYIAMLPISENTRILLQAMLLGDKSQLKKMSEIFRATGTSHVLAISGLHVGIVASLLHFLLLWIPARHLWLKNVLIILGVWGFCLLSGAAPSTLRASIMVSSFLIGRALNVQGMSYNFCFLSGFFMLLYNPLWVYDIGFQFSFLAILGILFFYDLLYNAFLFKGIMDRIWQMTVLSISAQLALMPLSLYYFHEFPVLFIPASIVAIPATFLMISVGLLGLFLRYVADVTFVLELLEWFCHLFLDFLNLLSNQEGMVLKNLYPTLPEMGIYFTCLFGISYYYTQGKKLGLSIYVLGFVGLLSVQFYLNHSHNEKHLICYADSSDIIVDVVQSGQLVAMVEAATKASKLPYIREPMRNKLGVYEKNELTLNSFTNQEINIGDFTLGIWSEYSATFNADTLDLLLINRRLDLDTDMPPARLIVDFDENKELRDLYHMLHEEPVVLQL